MSDINTNDTSEDLAPEDLDLIDDSLEDAGKDEDALWSEFDEAEQSAASDDAGEGSPPPDEGRAEDAGDEWSAADAESAQDRDNDSASDNGQAPDGNASGEAETGDTQQNDTELWANATPEQRAAFEAAQQEKERLQHQLRSNSGRISALQRQLNEIQAAQANPQQQAASSEAAGQQGQGEGQEGEGQEDGFLASEDWQSFREEYPEVAAPLEKVVGNLQAEITRQNKELSAIGQERRQSALEEQADLLSEAHPDWQEVTSNQAFVDWLNDQPRHIREAAYRNGQDIVDAEEAADVVGRFKAQQQSQGGGPTQQAAPRSNGQGSGNNKLAGKRQRQLESASATRSRGPGPATGIPEDGDPEQIWKQFDEMERRTRG
ncbi:hypothetical protein [Fodinicurvata sediminis]|uniref:hypothetical protein n=1 Tax=Fodinicurvata sediminis TaxID=1121832 RepID=UPI0003B39DEA|nr:hypothetical protein [Fodinicurvata sediminis]